ncbi:MAG: hypothetical protein IAF38_04950 [Bacteroidia bacterium]|nr:hypothetical protein [Bacteroidia bacterium]
MKFIITLILLFITGNLLFSQSAKKLQLTFNPTFNNSALNLSDSSYTSNRSDSLQIETLKFYISEIELLNDNKVVWKEENSFHLIDAAEKKTLSNFLNLPTELIYNKIKFNLGIDSVTNVAGAMGGDLDPTKGMYWTWQSGYVNFKLEGNSLQNADGIKEKKSFQFHLGGYMKPFYPLQTITLNVTEKDSIKINLDAEKIISVIDLQKQHHIMSPCKEAVMLSEKIAKIFSVQQP